MLLPLPQVVYFRLGRFIMENEREDAKENKIILLTIKNVVYPINTDVIYRVASLSGTVEKIVIFKKKFLQVTFLIISGWNIADKAREISGVTFEFQGDGRICGFGIGKESKRKSPRQRYV